MKEFGQLQVINAKHTKLELEERYISDKEKRKEKKMTMWDSVKIGVWMGVVFSSFLVKWMLFGY
jgi:hypothetical protein